MKTRLVIILAVYVSLFASGWFLGDWLSQWPPIQVRPINEPEIHRVLMAMSVVYVLAAATPFVPGAEVGLGMIAVFGSRIVVLVYICMFVALTLAYLVGRLIPVRLLARMFAFIRLERASDLILEFSKLDQNQRSAMLVNGASGKWGCFLFRKRYIALAMALNIPGNSLVGGGGGLSLLAGMSGLFGFAPFCLTIAVAIAPLPLIILLTGYQPN